MSFKSWLIENFVDSNEFRSWFAGSKVVDKNGNPLAVYHGSQQNEYPIEKFKGLAFFTGNPDLAAKYAGYGTNQQRKVGAIYPVYLSLKNPLLLSPTKIEEMKLDFKEILNYLTDRQVSLYNKWTQRRIPYAELYQLLGKDRLVQDIKGFLSIPTERISYYDLNPLWPFIRIWAEKKGYDGVISPHDTNKNGWNKKNGDLEYIVFRPGQIKSIYGQNQDAFHPGQIKKLYTSEEPW